MTTKRSSMPVYDPAQVSGLFGGSPANQCPDPKEGYMTFFDPGWSLMAIRKSMNDRSTIFWEQNWYESYEFATRHDAPQFRQLRMEPLPGSLGKTFAEQQALLPEGEEVPSARVVVMGMVLHSLATEERLFLHCYVRTSDVVADNRVSVGYFGAAGLCVGRRDVFGNDGVGLASLRKFY